MVQVSVSADSLSHQKEHKTLQHQSSLWVVKALEKDGSWVKVEDNLFILT